MHAGPKRIRGVSGDVLSFIKTDRHWYIDDDKTSIQQLRRAACAQRELTVRSDKHTYMHIYERNSNNYNNNNNNNINNNNNNDINDKDDITTNNYNKINNINNNNDEDFNNNLIIDCDYYFLALSLSFAKILCIFYNRTTYLLLDW